MHIRYLAVLSLMASLSAQNLVYSNGPFQTGVSGGNAISVLQTAAPQSHTTFGYGAQVAGPNRLVDNFTVNSFMQVDEIEVFGYLTGGVAPSATDIRLSIFSADPATFPAPTQPTQLIAGAGSATNLFTAAGFTVTNTLTNVFRTVPTPIGLTRNIQSIRVVLQTPVALVAGSYWIEYQYTGVNFSAPITTTNVSATGDAKQGTTATTVWANLLNGTFSAGIPFNFYSAVGAPISAGSITNLGGGCSTATLTVEGAPTVGGYVRAELANVNPLAIGLIIVGGTNPNSPLFVCACTAKASLDVLTIGNTFELQVPKTASLVGVELFVQGAQLDLLPVGGIAACNLGVQFDLTDGFSYKLNFN